MNGVNDRGGYTLVELLLGLAISAIILLPLADMLRTSADSARMVRSRLDLNADAGFAIERIAARAASAKVDTAPGTTQDWLKLLGFEECPATRELLEAASCSLPDRSGLIAANVDRIALSLTDGGATALRIALTLSHPDAGEPVTRVRTVRVGAHP